MNMGNGWMVKMDCVRMVKDGWMVKMDCARMGNGWMDGEDGLCEDG
jgi:hypothetical protein